VIAIPTTAGSGSEATHFAVVYRDGEKHSVAHASLRPAAAIVDPALTANLPPDLSAHSGLDALCQAVESIWSIHATEDSLAPAQAALALTWQHLETAVNEPTPAARSAMAWGAHLAGQAINLTQTTAPHAMSYTLTSAFGIPHGAAVALTLGPVLAFNARVNEADCVDCRGPESVQERLAIICETIGVNSPEHADAVFRNKVVAVGCPVTFSGAGIEGTDLIDRICNQVNPERLANNPRRLTPAAMREMLESIC
jgi:alcohol dehydrogenase class IV